MGRLFRFLKRLGLALLVLLLLLLSPVAYTELACRSEAEAGTYAALLPSEHHRPEARALLTYPEWHIVHAYDDYAEVIRTSDPHDFGYSRAIGGFWSSLCALSEASGAHGGFPTETKQMIYTIGVSFTAEMLLKAAYEETLGRAATWVRGEERAPLDDLSATQAAAYARFLQQVPWYKYDFPADKSALQSGGSFRDAERRFALGLEYSSKAAYAGLIAKAAAATIGPDDLTLRMIVQGIPDETLKSFEGVTVIATRPEGTEIETPRYRKLTHLLQDMAERGATFVEIAGNDDIMFTATALQGLPGALHVFDRQGYGDTRSIVVLPVTDLAETLRTLAEAPSIKLEHIHDY